MKQRTIQQNKAVHKFFEKLSEELNNAGYTVLKTLRKDIEIDWTPTLIKELIWKQIQKAMYDKSHTSELSSGELQMVYETLNRHLGERFGIYVPFPSIEAMLEEEKNKRKYDYPEHDREPEF